MLKTFKTPSGGTYQREVKDRPTRTKKSEIHARALAKQAARRAEHESRGTGSYHKPYDYINKKGTKIHVRGHTEFPPRRKK